MSNNAKKLKLVKSKPNPPSNEHLSKSIKQIDATKISNLKQIFIDWSSTVDINAYAKLFEYKSSGLFVQGVWLLIFLVLTGATFWLISLSIVDYLKVILYFVNILIQKSAYSNKILTPLTSGVLNFLIFSIFQSNLNLFRFGYDRCHNALKHMDDVQNQTKQICLIFALQTFFEKNCRKYYTMIVNLYSFCRLNRNQNKSIQPDSKENLKFLDIRHFVLLTLND
jgi:hypothetical protein